MMIRHPLSRTEYHRNADGTVLVIKPSTGVSGTFDRDGNWLHGERRTADAALCMWVADGASEMLAQSESSAVPVETIPRVESAP